MTTLFELKDKILNGYKIRLPHWNKNEYIFYKPIGNKFVTENDEDYDIETEFLFSDKWEIYKKTIDYAKCVGCLCRFWNEEGSYVYGILNSFYEGKFEDQCGVEYSHCEPTYYCQIEFYVED